MQTYSDYAPTGFDTHGMGLPDRQGWLVFIGQNRDSDALARSNFTVATETLEGMDPDGEDHEVHSFGHWACGWIEIIIVRPDSKSASEAEGMEAALADYPVLDDEHYSALEYDEHYEWADSECRRVATGCLARDLVGAGETYQDINDATYDAGEVMSKLQWYSERDASPSDEDLIETLSELGMLSEDP